MSVGLIALLDDVAAIAKAAAASLDDVAMTAAKASKKAAGIVVDDAAVLPGYAQGLPAARELPIIAKIGLGSLANKLLILLPAGLALSAFAPWAIMPLLLIGGLYLCYEGAEKVLEAFFHAPAKVLAEQDGASSDPASLETAKVWGAIKTDFILSAEIMAITLAEIGDSDIGRRAAVMAFVAVAITLVVYGGVALLLKIDDIGLAMSRSSIGGAWNALGRGLVKAMPPFMKMLSIVGTAAMIWVGGGIVVHALATFGLKGPEHLIEALAEGAAHGVPALGGFLNWVVTAAASGVVGLAVGAAVAGVIHYALAPLFGAVSGKRSEGAA